LPQEISVGRPHARGMDNRGELLAAVGGELLRQRSQLGLSLEEAAASGHVDAARLAAAEGGDTPLSADELDRMAGAYGVDVTSFFGGHTTPLAYLAGA